MPTAPNAQYLSYFKNNKRKRQKKPAGDTCRFLALSRRNILVQIPEQFSLRLIAAYGSRSSSIIGSV
ncbi:hypothetical protein C7972_12448 [Arenibacter sp. ARW7G5Y1]|nr:hypothetical protein C7972_12448 [Arenibacter sp. ARW7G5Y1]